MLKLVRQIIEKPEDVDLGKVFVTDVIFSVLGFAAKVFFTALVVKFFLV